MSSRVTRALLKLYPRRVRDRYGDELLDLQDELRAHRGVSRVAVIRDMLAGALLARPVGRAHLLTAAVIVIGALALAGTIIGQTGTQSPAAASHLQGRLAMKNITVPIPHGSCFVDGSCSLTPCSEFTAQPATEGSVANIRLPASRGRAPLAATRCARYPQVGQHRAVFVGD